MISLPELKNFTVVQERPQFCIYYLHKIFYNKSPVASFFRGTSQSMLYLTAQFLFRLMYLHCSELIMILRFFELIFLLQNNQTLNP
jgi:hypothetical protein